MKMCPKSQCLLILLWIFEVNSQILNYPGLNGGCMDCQTNRQTNGYYYGSVPWYPQYRQGYYQYPSFGQNFQQYSPNIYSSNQPQLTGNQLQYLKPPSNQISLDYLSPVNKVPETKITSYSENKYGTVKTEVIDIDPQYFRYLYSSYLPKTVGVPNSKRISLTKQSPYVVKIDSHQYNSTNIPQVIKKHDVQHKTFTFKKTYVLKPGEKDSVINLNFVNGMPLATEKSEDLREETTDPASLKITTTEEPGITSEEQRTTTENDIPKQSGKGGRRFIEIPDGCPEDTIFSEGQCWKKFRLPW